MLTDWLNRNAPGYNQLSKKEKDVIMQFPFLWSLFEAKVLDFSASATSIQKKMASWDRKNLLKESAFKKYKEYFSKRYIENNEPNDRFVKLHLRNSDNPCLVLNVLKGMNIDLGDIVSALLIIVLRYRNNFFHGIKWSYEFHGQLNNFLHANELLMMIIETNNSQ